MSTPTLTLTLVGLLSVGWIVLNLARGGRKG